MRRLCFIFTLCLLTELTFSQVNSAVIGYQHLVQYKVDEKRFELGLLPNSFEKVPCFRDYTKSSFRVKTIDPKTDSLVYADQKEYELKIIPDLIMLDKEKKLFRINGQITGGWEDVMPMEFEVYIGHRIDTISYITFRPGLHRMFGGDFRKVDTTFILDTVPAFYLTNFKKFDAFNGEKKIANSDYQEIRFDISAVIDEKSILIFGLFPGYSEIFEIGKLLNANNAL